MCAGILGVLTFQTCKPVADSAREVKSNYNRGRCFCVGVRKTSKGESKDFEEKEDVEAGDRDSRHGCGRLMEDLGDIES